MKYDVIDHPKGIIKVRKGYYGDQECLIFSVRLKEGFTFHGVTERTSVPWYRGRGFAYRYASNYDTGLKLSREYLDRAIVVH